MDEKVLGQISIYETLYKSHIPNPLSYPSYNAGRLYPEFSSLEHCIGWGKGECIFLKVVQFYESTQKFTDNYKILRRCPKDFSAGLKCLHV